jgi:hypothetical protein
MTTNYEQAKERMTELDFSEADQEIIFSDWNNYNEHLEWLLSASREEIADWIEITRRGIEEEAEAKAESDKIFGVE